MPSPAAGLGKYQLQKDKHQGFIGKDKATMLHLLHRTNSCLDFLLAHIIKDGKMIVVEAFHFFLKIQAPKIWADNLRKAIPSFQLGGYIADAMPAG